MARVFARPAFLGQLPADPQNRLLPIKTGAIVNRRMNQRKWTPKGVINRMVAFREGDTSGQFIQRFGQAAYNQLFAVFRGPTKKELNDLGLIDRFFTPPINADFVAERFELNICSRAFTDVQRRDCEAFQNPFFHPPGVTYAPKIQLRTSIIPDLVRMVFVAARPTTGAKWGTPQDKPWGETKTMVENAVLFDEVQVKYPWPNPPDKTSIFWWANMAQKAQEFVNQPRKLTEEQVRDFITITMLDNWNTIMAQVQRELEKAAERAEKRAVFTKIAFAALAVVGLAAGGAGIILTGVKTANDIRNQKKMVSDLKSASEQLRATDAAFADEVDRLSFKLEKEAEAAEARAAALIAKAEALEAENRRKAEEAAKALSPPGEVEKFATPVVAITEPVLNAAIQQGAEEGRREAEAVNELERNLPTVLLVGGGLIALGLGAYFILRK